MTTINYTETKLGRGEVLIEWASLAAGDVGQTFELVGYEMLSIHQYKTGGANLVCNLRQSNNLSAPTSENTGNFSATDDEIFRGVDSFPIKSRYVWPLVASGSGQVSFSMLLKEI